MIRKFLNWLGRGYTPLPPPDKLPPPPPSDPSKCRRCGAADVYRGGLCKRCDDDDFVALVCCGMFTG